MIKNFWSTQISSVAKSKTAIARRVKGFLASTDSHAPGVSSLFRDLNPIGEVLLFGGLLRNAALFGLTNFRSDIDVVVAGSKAESLARVLDRFGPVRNSFGGYRLRLDSFQVDIWTLDSTWAFRKGLVKGETVEDLLQTTFFNWDAIAYSLNSGTLYSKDGYIEEIRGSFLDIVLSVNPNPIGMLKRTVNLIKATSAVLSPSLVTFVLDTVEQNLRTNAHFGAGHSNLLALSEILHEHLSSKPGAPVGVSWQGEFWEGARKESHISRSSTSRKRSKRRRK